MINFLPQIYENELLYSIIARYQRKCGMMSNKKLVEDIYGSSVSVTSSYFPQYIGSFVKQLPVTSKITVEDIIQKHTMYRLYTSFISEKKAENIFNLMQNGARSPGNNVEKYVAVGAGKIKKPPYLRYCPLCYINDLKIRGESYWRTNHQITAALYCSDHHVLLKNSTVLSTFPVNQYICADEDVCNSEIEKDNYSSIVRELNLKYIKNAETLLKINYPKKELSFITSFYIDKLRDIGFASANGNLYIDKIQNAFLELYPKRYLDLMQSNFDIESQSNWLRSFVRNNDKNRSFVRHLLFLQFLELTPDQLFMQKKVIGRKEVHIQHTPKFSINERREQWLKLIADNPNDNRSKLKDKGKGLHSWITMHDWVWYDSVTPKLKSAKRKEESLSWSDKDKKCLQEVKEVHKSILSQKGKPLRVTPNLIQARMGAGRWLYNPKLKKTNEYLTNIKEDINHFRIRKIKWAINEMTKKNLPITIYKVQLYAGFGEGTEDIKHMIKKTLYHTD